jgi:hypothetical protein
MPTWSHARRFSTTSGTRPSRQPGARHVLFVVGWAELSRGHRVPEPAIGLAMHAWPIRSLVGRSWQSASTTSPRRADPIGSCRSACCRRRVKTDPRTALQPEATPPCTRPCGAGRVERSAARAARPGGRSPARRTGRADPRVRTGCVVLGSIASVSLRALMSVRRAPQPRDPMLRDRPATPRSPTPLIA